jgi:tetratricopeptide (TPR) repeat protein
MLPSPILQDLANIIYRHGPDRRSILLRRAAVRSNTKENSLFTRLLDRDSPLNEVRIDPKTASALKRRMLATVFHLELEATKTTIAVRRSYQLRRALFLVSVLTALGGRRAASSIARKYLPLAAKRQATSIRLELLNHLASEAAVNGKLKRFEKYQVEAISLAKVYMAEIEVIAEYRRVLLLASSSGDDHPEFAFRTFRASELAKRYYTDHKTYILGLCYYILRIAAQQMSRQHDLAVATCKEAIDFAESNKELSTTTERMNFYYQLGISHLHLKEYSSAQSAFHTCEQKARSGQSGWFLIRESQCYLLLRQSHFKNAQELIREATNHQLFNSQSDLAKDRWKLFNLYTQVALRELPDVFGTKKGALEVRRFFRSSPEFRGDKAGYNVSVLLLHMVVLIRSGRFKQALDRLEAIEVYRKRHVRRKQHPQAYLLLTLMKAIKDSQMDITQSQLRQFEKIRDDIIAMKTDRLMHDFLPVSVEWYLQELFSHLMIPTNQ